jgi:DNA-directed RNA polymerase subunit RPC12/RpoP
MNETNYNCKKCNKSFTKKYNLLRHINNCNYSGSKTMKKYDYKCNKCGINFTRKDSLTRHINKKICNKKKKQNNVKLSGNNNKQKIINGDMKCDKTNINNVIKSLNSNNIYNIILFSFGKDGIKNLNSKDYSQIFNSNKNVIESIISNVNLNPDKPQHHNVYYGDIKSLYGEIYENKKWIKMKIDEILDTLIETKLTDLNDILNDMGDILNKKTRNKIKETIENFDYTKPGARKKLKTYLKPILYNHKDIIIKTRKLTKEQEEEIFRKEQEEAEKEAEEEELKQKQKKRQK